jgi:hypothetical protein
MMKFVAAATFLALSVALPTEVLAIVMCWVLFQRLIPQQRPLRPIRELWARESLPWLCLFIFVMAVCDLPLIYSVLLN